MAGALIVHFSGGRMLVSRYGSDGKLVSEGIKEYVDVKCSGSVRISRYEFGDGALIVIEG